MKNEPVLSFEVANEILSYDKASGCLTWKVRRSIRVCAGDIAGGITFHGSSKKPYVSVGIRGRVYKAHRLAFLLETGSFPNEDVDHINGNGLDNRWSNLRVVSKAENSRNMRRTKSNTSGVTGVQWLKSRERWIAMITLDKKPIRIGTFVNFEDAVRARKIAETQMQFHTNHGSDRPL